jgi:hypothetical protein
MKTYRIRISGGKFLLLNEFNEAVDSCYLRVSQEYLVSLRGRHTRSRTRAEAMVLFQERHPGAIILAA